MRDIERVTRSKSEPMPLPENFNELVRNLPKPAQPPRDTGSKGRDPNRQRQEANRGRGGAKPQGERGPRRDGAAGEGAEGQRKRRFRPRNKSVGAHKSAVKRVG
jgi:ATP-dependent RNA helicase RhlE